MIKSLRIVIFWIAVLLIACLLPIFPRPVPSLEDPKTIDDKRITANISNNDLEKILNIVREPNFIPIYKYLSTQSGMSVSNISTILDTNESVDENTNKDVVILLKSKDGGVGRLIKMSYINEKWTIVNETSVFY